MSRQFVGIPKVLTAADLCVQIDSREQRPYTFPGAQTERVGLVTGDYGLKGLPEVALERKSREDLIGVCGAGRDRFLRELRRLKAYRYSLIVVEADWRDLAEGVWPGRVGAEVVLGSLVSWSMEFCPILLCGDRKGGERAARKFLLAAARHRHAELRGFARELEAP